MVAFCVFGLLSAGLTMFWVESSKAANFTQQQIRMMGEMRTLSSELLFNASRAHELIIYNSPRAADRVDASSRRQIVVDEDTNALQCPTGNLAVFVYYELPKPRVQSRYRIARLVAYALDQNGTEPGRLSRITINLTGSPSTSTVEAILEAYWSTAERKTYADLISPLALSDVASESTTPRLFYKRSEQNLAVCGQLLRSSSDSDTRDRRTVTRTVFFTVTTRS
jgi:hypothetical protein